MKEKCGGRSCRYPFVGLGLATALACNNAPLSRLSVPESGLDAPDFIDFETIPDREWVESQFEIENVGRSSLELLRVVPMPSASPPGVSLEADAPSGRLVPGDVVKVDVRVRSEGAIPSDVLGGLSFELEGFSPEDPSLPRVEVRGRVSISGLRVDPNPLTIGPVPYLETSTGGLSLRNLRGSETLEVYALRHESGRALFDEALTRGTFGELPPVAGDGLLTRLGPGETFPVEIAYTAPGGPGEAKEQAVWSLTTCPSSPQACGLAVIVQGIPDTEGPVFQVRPASAHFGPTPLNELVERSFTISNQGVRDLVLKDVNLDGSQFLGVELGGQRTLARGEFVEGRVTYRPAEPGLHNAVLTVKTNDPLQRTASIRMSGAAVILPPCRFEALPAEVMFGPVELGEERQREVRIRNTGTDGCLMFDPRIEAVPGTDAGAFRFGATPPPSVRLGPGEDTALPLVFEPTRLGEQGATLSVRTSNGESLQIPLRGETPDDGERIVCTGPRQSPVERSVSLSASVTGAAEAQRYEWRVLRAPPGQTYRLAPNPSSREITFTPLAVGSYDLEVRAMTTEGTTLTCATRVDAGSTGLQVTLTWDGSGDLDLHLRRGDAAAWYSEDDCHFDNLTPTWINGQQVGQGANPTLDRDDTSGDGPENIRIRAPEIGVPYFVAVSHFERASGRTARVEVNCGRGTNVLDIRSRPFRGNQTGSCSRNDFWTVASLTFSASDQCTVDRIDTYQTTREACGSQ